MPPARSADPRISPANSVDEQADRVVGKLSYRKNCGCNTSYSISGIASGSRNGGRRLRYSPPWAVRNTFVYPSGGGDSTTVDSAFQAYVGDDAGDGDDGFIKITTCWWRSTPVFPTLYRGMPHDAI